MKKIFVLMMTVLAVASAEARREKAYVIDMTGKNFEDQGFNLMDDGISEPFDYVAVKLDGRIHQDFEVVAHATDPKDTCKVVGSKSTSGKTVLRLDVGLETDEGELCEIRVNYRDGRKATLSIEETGT
jgi:hypothetical protein